MLPVRKHPAPAFWLPVAQAAPGSTEPRLCFRTEAEPVAGKRQDPVGAGRPAGEELSSVEPQGGGRSGPVPKSAVVSNNTGRVSKPGLLAVEATVKGFTMPW